MASRKNEEETSDTTTMVSPQQQSSSVRFDLDGSHRAHNFDESLDETDEFLELSTLSNPPSTSSFDSPLNGHTNDTRRTSINGTTHENRTGTKHFSRWAKRLVWRRKKEHIEKKILTVPYSSLISFRKMSGVILNSSASLRSLPTVTTPKEFTELLGGERVINKVNWQRTRTRSDSIPLHSLARFWSRTMALLRSNACVQFEGGRMKCFDKRMLSSSSLWLLLKICKRMLVRSFPVLRHYLSLFLPLQNTFAMPITTSTFKGVHRIWTIRTANWSWILPSVFLSKVSRSILRLLQFINDVLTSGLGWMGSCVWESEITGTSPPKRNYLHW